MSAPSAGTAWVEIRPDWGNFNRELSSGLKRAGSAMSDFGGSLTRSITLPLAAAAGAAAFFGLKTASSLQQAEVAFTTLTGSAEKGKQVMEDLKSLAAVTPFQTADLTTTAQRLINAGVATEDLTRTITALGDAAGTQGAQGLDRLGFAFSQVMGSGRAMTEDINQIADVGVPIWGELAAQMGVTQAEVRDMAKEGKISSDVMVKAFEQPVGPMKNLVGGMAAQSKTLAGVWSTFQDTVGQALADAFTPEILANISDSVTKLGAALGPALQALVPVFSMVVSAMVPVVEFISGLLVKFTELSPTVQKIIIGVLAFAAALGPIISVVGAVSSALGAIGAVVGAISLPLIAVVAAIGLAAFLIIKNFDKIKAWFDANWPQIWAGLKPPLEAAWAFIQNVVKVAIAEVLQFVQDMVPRLQALWDKVLEAVQTAWGAIGPIISDAIAIIKFLAPIVANVIGIVWGVLQGLIGFMVGTLWPVFLKVWTAIAVVIGVAYRIIRPIVIGIAAVIGAVIEAVQFLWKVWRVVWAVLSFYIEVWWAIVKAILTVAWHVIEAVFKAVSAVVTAVWGYLWDNVISKVVDFWNWVQPYLATAWAWLVGQFEGTRDNLLIIWNWLWDNVISKVIAFWDWIKPYLEDAWGTLTVLFNSVKDAVLIIWNWLWDNVITKVIDFWEWAQPYIAAAWVVLTAMFNAVKDAVLLVWNWLWDNILQRVVSWWSRTKAVFETARDTIITIFNTVKDTVSRIWDAITSKISGAVETIKNFASGLWDGMKSGVNFAIGMLNDFINKANDAADAMNPFGDAPWHIPTIPLMAKGGVVMSPTMAIVGEAGPEAVIPLGRLDAMLGEGSGRGDVYLRVYIGDKEITDLIEKTVKEEGDDLARRLVGGRRL